MVDKTQIGQLFDETWNTYKEKFFLLATILLFFQFIPQTIYGVYNILNPVEITRANIWNYFLMHGPLGLVLFFIGFIGTVAILYVLLKNRKTNTLSEALSGGIHYYLPALGVTLLVTIMLIPLLILLIIPGLIFSVYWMFSQYIVIDKDEKVTKSIGKSMDIVKGNWWAVFGKFALALVVMIIILLTTMAILGLMMLIIAGPTILITGANPGLEIISAIISNAVQLFLTMFFIIFSTQLYFAYRDKYEEEQKRTEKTNTQKTKTTKK